MTPPPRYDLAQDVVGLLALAGAHGPAVLVAGQERAAEDRYGLPYRAVGGVGHVEDHARPSISRRSASAGGNRPPSVPVPVPWE